MNRTDAKNYIRQQEPFFLDKAKKTGYICPFCGNGSGANGDGIVKDKKDPTGTHYKCFVCGQYVDIIDLVGAYYNIDPDDTASKFSKAFEVFGINVENEFIHKADINGQKKAITPPVETPPEDYTSFFKEAAAMNNYEYLQSRGISEETQRRFMVGFVPDWISPQAVQTTLERGGDPAKLPRSPRCIIPTSRGSYIARDTRSDLTDEQKRFSKQKQGKQSLFNIKALEQSEAVFITEGEIDALSIEEAGGKAVGLGSAAMIRNFVAELPKRYNGQVFILCLDNDEPGQLAQTQLAESLASFDIRFIDGSHFTHSSFKDPNEALTSDPDAFRRAVSYLQAEALKLTAAGSVREYCAADLLEYFRTIESQPEGIEAKTGFKFLDTKLQGGLHEGLYIIGAVSSLGKTTFTLQMADQIAANGQDVLFFSLEMSKYELIAKSISRHSFICTGGKKDCFDGKYLARDTAQVLNARRYKDFTAEERKAVNDAIQSYQKSANRLFIYEGRYKGQRLTVQHIKEITKKHVEVTGNTPLVFVDYLQIIAPADVRASDKQNTDTAVFELKELSRDLKTVVFAISSFNRDNYSEPVNMASFKESGAVEYSSDVLFGLQYAGMDYQPGETDGRRKERLRDLTKDNFRRKELKEPIKIELKCLKNRNGYQFTAGFNMMPAFNYFEEAQTATAANNPPYNKKPVI